MSNTSVTSSSPSPCQTNRLVFSFSESALSYFFGLSIIAALMTLVTVILNCIFLASMVRQKQLCKSISNKLLIVLSLNDLMQGILLWPLIVVNWTNSYKMQPSCFTQDLMYFMGYHFAVVTMSTILLVALEQFIAILHPYFYIKNVTFCCLLGPMLLLNSVILIINVAWAIKLTGMWIVFGKLLFVPLFATMVVALIYMHTKIMRCAANVAAKITDTNREEGKQIKTRAKAAKSGLVVLIATLVCYSPFICYTIVVQFRERTPFMTTFIQNTTEILGLLSSLVDPVVYYWRLKSIRKATKQMFHSICKKHTRVHCVTND